MARLGEAYFRDWANRSYEQVRGSLACVPGDVVRLYHGIRQNRQYVERYNMLHENAYDPVRELRSTPGRICSSGPLPRGSESRIWSGVLLSISGGGGRMNEGKPQRVLSLTRSADLIGTRKVGQCLAQLIKPICFWFIRFTPFD